MSAGPGRTQAPPIVTSKTRLWAYDQFGIEHISTRYSARYRAHTHLTDERSITTMRE